MLSLTFNQNNLVKNLSVASLSTQHLNKLDMSTCFPISKGKPNDTLALTGKLVEKTAAAIVYRMLQVITKVNNMFHINTNVYIRGRFYSHLKKTNVNKSI